MVATSELAILISTKDGSSKPLNDISSALGNVGKAAGAPVQALGSLGSALGGVASLAIGGGIAAVAGGFVAAGKAAADFEGVMSGVKAVSGATQSEMDGLSKLALQLGKDTAFSASEAAAGMEELVKGGLSIPDIMNGAAQATLDLAAAGGVSLPEAATIAANALAQFNLKGEDMAHVADVIAGAANASAIDVGQFKLSLQSAGAVAATVGFSFDDLAQGIAVMGKAGIAGSDAGTSLKTMMLNLQPSTKAATAEMEKLGLFTTDNAKLTKDLTDSLSRSAQGQKLLAGVNKDGVSSASELYKAYQKLVPAVKDVDFNTFARDAGATSNAFFDATGKVKSMAEVADLLQVSMKDLTEQQRLQSLETLFGSDAIRAGAVLAKEGAKGFNEMAASMGKVSAKAVGLEKLNNAAGDFQALQGSLETAAITLGVAFLPAIRKVTQAAIAAVNAAIPFLEAWGPKLISALDAAGSAIDSVVTAVADAVAIMLGLDPGAYASAWEELGAIVQIAFAFFTKGANDISSFVIPIIQSFGDIITKVMKGDLAGALNAAIKHIGTFVPKVVDALAEWAAAFIAWVAPMIPPLLKELADLAARLTTWVIGEALPAIVTKLLEWGKAFVAWVAPQIPGLLAEAGKLLVGLVDWVVASIPQIVAKLVEWGMAFVAWIAPQIPPLLVELGKLYIAMQTWMITVALPAIIGQLVKWGAAFVGWVVTDVLPKLPGELLKINKAVVDFLNQAASDFLTEAGKTGAALFKGFMDELGKLAPAAWNAIAGDDAGSLKSRMYSALKDAIDHAIAGVNKWIDDLIAPFRRAWETIKNLLDKIRGAKPDVDSGGGAGPPTGGGGAPKISSFGPRIGVPVVGSQTVAISIDARGMDADRLAAVLPTTLATLTRTRVVAGAL